MEVCRSLVNPDKSKDARFGNVPDLPYGYKLSALVMAYNIEKATGTVVLNPFILQPKSLMDVDEVWLTARSRLYQWIEYAEDMEKEKGKV